MLLLDLLGDEHVRTILAATSDEPRSVKSLSDVCDISRTTTYRKVDRLVEHGLLESETRLDRNGNHYQVYRSAVRGILVVPDDDELKTDVCLLDEEDSRLVWIWKRVRDL